MTTTEHPIAPPPELVQQWAMMFEHFSDAEVFTQVARWGANQELEACCEWLDNQIGASDPNDLRAERRPKPPSLKEQALHELADVYDRDKIEDSTYDTIRRALEQLDD
jgi:hypothetical protein